MDNITTFRSVFPLMDWGKMPCIGGLSLQEPAHKESQIESAREMLDKLAPEPVDHGDKSKPLVYWSNRLCNALEAKVIDAELVARCIESIREHY